MAKTYKILVNDGKGTDIKPVSVMQGASAKGEPVRMTAKRGWRFELQDDLKGKNLGPDQVRLKRMGKNLGLMFDASVNPDVIIEDFYAENEDKEKDNGSPMIVGQAEDGGMYEYVPQDPAASSMASQLKDGNTPVIVALGGGPLAADFALAGLPLIAAAGGGIGGLLAGGAALVAAAAAGGGGGGGSAGAVPSGQTGHITHDAANDTGVSTSDSYTKNNTPQLTVNAESGATVVVNVNGKDYPAKETSTKGVYTANVADVLPDGVYTPVIKVTNSAGSSSANGVPFIVDTSSTDNQDTENTPTKKADDNFTNAEIKIVSISSDSGKNSDFITSDNTLIFNGTVTGYNASNGDVVRVQVLDAGGKTVIDKYVTISSSNTWAINNEASTMAQGSYTIKAIIEDKAGNVVKSANQQLTITAENILVVQNETVTVNENINIPKTTIANGVLANDGDTTVNTVKAVKVVAGDLLNDKSTFTTNASTISGSKKLIGSFGQLELFETGEYIYTQDPSKVNPLTANGAHGTDTFTYEVQAFLDATAQSRPQTLATLTFDIVGVNDPASLGIKTAGVTGPNLLKIDNAADGHTSSSSTFLTVGDEDNGEKKLNDQYGTTKGREESISGGFGSLKVTNEGDGKYSWVYLKTASHQEGVQQHDLFTFDSSDGTASTTLDFRLDTKVIQDINGTSVQTPVTEHHAHGQLSTNDALIFKDPIQDDVSQTFNFTDSANGNDEIKLVASSVEVIDITGATTSGGTTVSNTIKLNLSSLLQTDTFNGTNHRLYINGDQGDTVNFNLDSTPTAIAHDAAARLVDGTSYWVYHIGTDELLVQTAISQITVNG